LTLGGAVLFSSARFEAYGAFWPSQTAHVAAAPVAGGDVFLADGGARACWTPPPRFLAFAVCPGLEAGVLHGQGRGIRVPRPADSVWFAATALSRAYVRVAPAVSFFLEVSLAVPFFRDQFALDDVGTIHQAAVVESRAALGPELRF
jgi:hypothetical protein